MWASNFKNFWSYGLLKFTHLTLSVGQGLALLAFYEKRIFKQRALANLNRVKRYEDIQNDATERDYAPIRQVRSGWARNPALNRYLFMKYRYSRFKSGILYCALQKKYLPAGAENFRARSGPQGAGVAKTWGSLVAQFEGPFCEILTKKSQKKIRNPVHKSPLTGGKAAGARVI